ncbi:MAG: heavy metal translocating P-type ATPase [Planctomycetota bacterium]
MAHAHAAAEADHPHEHEHVGSVQTRLIITFIGGVLVANAYLADYVLFPDDEVIGGISALLGALILATPIVIGAVKEMKHGSLHMDVLVAIAVISAFALSGYEVGGREIGGYKVGGIVAFFMLLANLIEQQTAAGARESVERLMTLTPETAELVSGETVAAEELNTGDRIRVRPGDRIPADGRILEGETTIDEATITGESVPADKAEGEDVFAGTHNLTGAVVVEVTSVGEDTTLGKVKHLILDAERTKTPVMQIIDRYAEWYTPVVLMIAGIVWVFTKDPNRFVSVLVIACPCAFVLATPTAMVAGLSAAARLGILIKNVAHLEAAGDISAMVFDKTGTLTTGELTVTRLKPAGDVEPVELLEAAASVEQNSRHPVAQAITKVADRTNVALKNVENFQETPGKGVVGTVGGEQVLVGRREFLQDRGVDMSVADAEQHRDAVEGMSVLYVSKGGRCIGWAGLEDRARPEARESTGELRELGVKRLSMLTGDRWSVAKKVAGELGCTDVQGECLPEQKLRLVEMLREEGHRVAVVGDGVNDAPALAAGDLGIAMGAAGSDVAINSASIALMADDLGRLPFLVKLSRRLRSVIMQNLLFGGVFVVVGLLLTSLGYLGPIVAALLHNVGSFIVIFNSARLVRFGENLTPYSGTVVDRTKGVPVSA